MVIVSAAIAPKNSQGCNNQNWWSNPASFNQWSPWAWNWNISESRDDVTNPKRQTGIETKPKDKDTTVPRAKDDAQPKKVAR